jgi:hypothetical protein
VPQVGAGVGGAHGIAGSLERPDEVCDTPIGCQTVLNSMSAVIASGLRSFSTPRTTRFKLPAAASCTALSSSALQLLASKALTSM